MVLIPLFYVTMWLGVAACILLYSLIAGLANKDFDVRNGSKADLSRFAVQRMRQSQTNPSSESSLML